MMMPFCTATPKSAMKPTPEATLSVWPVRWSEISERHDPEDQDRLAHRPQSDGEEDQHQAHDETEDHDQP